MSANPSYTPILDQYSAITGGLFLAFHTDAVRDNDPEKGVDFFLTWYGPKAYKEVTPILEEGRKLLSVHPFPYKEIQFYMNRGFEDPQEENTRKWLENVLEILPNPAIGVFVKEDGERVASGSGGT